MTISQLENKTVNAYVILTSLVICGLAASLITAPKVIHLGVNFPFSNLVFSIFTYPIVDCICELWGKRAAQRTVLLGISSQIFIALIIQLSIIVPHANFWVLQEEYQKILSTGLLVIIANFLAFTFSQICDIYIYQRIKQISAGKMLWLRSNISTYLGQIIDSSIFVLIIFYNSPQKFNILWGSITIKIILSLLMTPVVYLIVMRVNKYLDNNTLAFKPDEELIDQNPVKETV
jgi:uncharacterized integral membrane protein (TIGR00697 family)